MATIEISPGLGELVAGDRISSEFHQRVKVSVGDTGAAADVSDLRPVPTRPGHPSTKVLTNTPVSVITPGDNILITATALQSTRIFRIVLVAAAAVSVLFKSGGTALTGAMPLTAGGSIVLDFDGEPWFVTGVNEAFVVNLSAAVAVTGFLQAEKSV